MCTRLWQLKAMCLTALLACVVFSLPWTDLNLATCLRSTARWGCVPLRRRSQKVNFWRRSSFLRSLRWSFHHRKMMPSTSLQVTPRKKIRKTRSKSKRKKTKGREKRRHQRLSGKQRAAANSLERHAGRSSRRCAESRYAVVPVAAATRIVGSWREMNRWKRRCSDLLLMRRRQRMQRWMTRRWTVSLRRQPPPPTTTPTGWHHQLPKSSSAPGSGSAQNSRRRIRQKLKGRTKSTRRTRKRRKRRRNAVRDRVQHLQRVIAMQQLRHHALART
mmetsp:Transcript_157409/g.286615  ORF Transcript_157409/g.286615 Transcript_157409/m.286615 type:complete len:274 (-) Transcript_157409:504-1325(-)